MDHVLEISFPSDDSLEELVQSRLFLTACGGSTQEDRAGTTTLAAWFSSPEEREAATSLLRDLAVSLDAFDRPRVDWLEQYEQSLHAIEIGASFVVAPDPSLLAERAGRTGIVVPQEQAFGTGSHETTALCITLLETLPVGGQRGMDIGSGTGILAIAALKLGAEKVIAFDNDLDAYGALYDNRRRNDVDPRNMPLFIGGTEALRAGRFDFVLMNIIPEVIIPLLPGVVERMTDRGTLIVSGVLIERRGDVLAAADGQGLAPAAEKTRGEWWAAALQRRR